MMRNCEMSIIRVENTVEKISENSIKDEKISESISIQKKNLPNFL
jgi:hypothetical protein